MSDTEKVIKHEIEREFLDGRDLEITENTALIDNEIIDSLGIFLLLGFIKETFGVEIEPEDVNLENFATVGAIARLVDGNRG